MRSIMVFWLPQAELQAVGGCVGMFAAAFSERAPHDGAACVNKPIYSALLEVR